jgi:hypothetical protein
MQQLITNHNEEIQTNNKGNKNSEEVQINGSSTRQSRNCETVFLQSSLDSNRFNAVKSISQLVSLV